MTTTAENGKATGVGLDPTNDAAEQFTGLLPYAVTVVIEGTATALFHRWSCEDVEAKAKAAKNSAAKKTDNVEAYVYRNDAGHICLPGEYLRQSIIGAAKFRQDPRSPRKSAMDLFKAAVVPLTELAPILGADGEPRAEWDFLDQRRVTVQRNGVTRVRPAFLAGWRAEFDLQVILPEYVAPPELLEVTGYAGRVVGVADHRPTYGRFQVVKFEVKAV